MLTKAGGDAVILAIWAVYRPPFDVVGAGPDRVVLRRGAQAAIREFTRRIGAAITDPAAPPGQQMPVSRLIPRGAPEPEGR